MPTGAESSSAPLPEPVTGRAGGTDPEHEVPLAELVGSALLVGARHTGPCRALPSDEVDEVAAIIERSPVAACQLLGRARHRAQASATVPTSPTPIAAADEQPTPSP